MRRWTILLAALVVLATAAGAQSIDEEEITDVAEGSADVRKPPFSVDDEDDLEEGSGRSPAVIDEDATSTTAAGRKETQPPKPTTKKGKDDVERPPKHTEAPKDSTTELPVEKTGDSDVHSSFLNTTTIAIIFAVVVLLIIIIIVVIVVLRRRSSDKDRRRGQKYTQGDKA